MVLSVVTSNVSFFLKLFLSFFVVVSFLPLLFINFSSCLLTGDMFSFKNYFERRMPHKFCIIVKKSHLKALNSPGCLLFHSHVASKMVAVCSPQPKRELILETCLHRHKSISYVTSTIMFKSQLSVYHVELFQLYKVRSTTIAQKVSRSRQFSTHTLVLDSREELFVDPRYVTDADPCFAVLAKKAKVIII